MDERETPPLLSLPSELVHHVLSYLNLSDLVSVGLVNHGMHEHALQDTLWQPFVQAEVPESGVTKPANLTWRELFQQHHPYWFLAKKKIWFADTAHTGKLLIARYDRRINAIEAYTLVAERRQPTFLAWDQHPDAIIHTFSPRVQLDLNVPVLRLNADAYEKAIGDTGHRLQKEIPMSVYHETPRQSAGIHSQLMLARPWPTGITTEATPVWPPLTLPSIHRSRNDASPSGFRQPKQKPATLDQLSTSTFRLRKWMEFSSRPHGVSMRIGEDITTWATLPEECYTPTPQKPWQGIWCGDYAGHGCEFLAIMQPDDPKPLPEQAALAMRDHEREGSVSSEGSWSTAPTGAAFSDNGDNMETAEDLEDSVSTLQEAFHERESASPDLGATSDDETVYRGRIEAVKLTGDPNIPRGEYTFIAPDIGPNGLLRVASEEIFKGARIVRSVGHIAARGFRDDNYMTSQLILISHDRLAQYWETFGHVSFYQRVDIDSLARV
ncbi:F-box domain-containing protein [Clathrospora elynae]|uniref:F-box domain-containing protein n=1 Tax=Clathrospora elynae TaxID=706981 RepID=A0A6A5SCI2_9PLEO|nr:F-box domain-containing protein [Clathrospora elynae]